LRVFKDCNDIYPVIESVVSTGTFDGVHLGHQTIIKEMITIAASKGLQSVAITFDPHPRIVLGKDENKLKLLNTLDEKIAIFESLGVDNVFVIQFTKEFAATPYEQYIKDFLVGKLGARHIVLGFNHQFGKQRSGNHDTLIALGNNYGYEVTEVSPQGFEGQVVSSTKIRQLLEEQNLDLANKLLGYHYAVTGTVVHGRNVGASIGYPTANIKITDRYKQLPAVGVYAVLVRIENTTYRGMCSIGYNPTFGSMDLSVEVNIFDFADDIYGKEIKLGFVSFLRQEIKFEGVNALIQQLGKDKENSLFKLNNIRE
jgi:riboflavin kinase / FMN adenylyltransferase